jgi:peptidoglycan hydrolase CwlO-like protein
MAMVAMIDMKGNLIESITTVTTSPAIAVGRHGVNKHLTDDTKESLDMSLKDRAELRKAQARIEELDQLVQALCGRVDELEQKMEARKPGRPKKAAERAA